MENNYYKFFDNIISLCHIYSDSIFEHIRTIEGSTD